MLAGSTATHTVSATVKSSATGTLSEHGDRDRAGRGHRREQQQLRTDDTTITLSSDLAVETDNGKTSVNAGASDTYAIVVTNNGPRT